MFNLKKKEDIFYDLFDGTMEKALEAANALVELLENYTDVDAKIAHLKEIEHECDLHVHKVLKALNASFVTPIDLSLIHI